MLHTWEFQDASTIPDDMFSSFIDAQIYCWGAAPFSEFVICEDDTCGKISSIEDVTGGIEDFVMKDIPIPRDFCCPSCQSSMKPLYDKESFKDILRQHFRTDVSAILLGEAENNIQGFGVLNKSSLEDVININFATRPQSFDYTETLQHISCVDSGIVPATEVICWHQLFLSKGIRDNNLFWKTLYDLFLLNPDYGELPILLETRYDSRIYPILSALGFTDVCNDKYGYVVQYFPKYQDFLAILEDNAYKTISIGDVRKYKRKASALLESHPEFLDKYYIA